MGAAELFETQSASALSWAAFADGFRAPMRISVAEWADRYRRLSSKGSPEPGQWRTARVPYLREIMDCLSPSHPARRIVFMKSVQSGGTECGNNWVGWFIHTQRKPMMIILPTLELAEDWSNQRLSSMIEDSPELSAIISPHRERDRSNTMRRKEFPGGVIFIQGANSPTGLRSRSVWYLMLDEVDAYPLVLEDEGNPIELAEGRVSAFPRSKIFLISTPTTESASSINKEYIASDQRRYHVPCPDCNHMQRLVWDNLNWPANEPEKARYVCVDCGALIDEHCKTWMLEQGEWRAGVPQRKVAGFHINGLYTPIGLGKSWSELADLRERASNDPIKLKLFVNLRLGEVSKDPNEKLEADELSERAEAVPMRTIPRGCVLLTAGVDVQKDRWAVLVLGWGARAVYIVDWFELPGDPTNAADWLKLETRVNEPIMNCCNVPMRAERIAVDSGYLQDDVLHFTRDRKARGWFAIKGAKDKGRPIISRPTTVDFTWRGRLIKSGAQQWQVGGYACKEWIFARLVRDRERLAEDRLVRFAANLGKDFYNQLTAEVFDEARSRFVKIRARNEALDTLCYAIAAGHHPYLRVHTWQEQKWAQRAQLFEPQGDLFDGGKIAAQEVGKPSAEGASQSQEKGFSLAQEKLKQLQERLTRESVYDE